MSISGVVGLFRGNPQHPIGDDGRMALSDHLRELRARLLKVALFLLVATIVALFFYPQLFGLIAGPYYDARRALGQDVDTKIVFNGVTDPLMIQLKVCGMAALVLGSPFWLYQIWAFIMPGLHPHEQRWTRVFVAIAGPLFIGGVAVGYYVLPKGLEVLIGFTLGGVENLVEFGRYFAFFTRMLLVFGVAFEIPLFVILLNLAGVVSGRSLARSRPWIVLGTFVFAAVATPSTDPFSMLMLAVPMLVLFLVSELIARLVDRRRARRADELTGLSDDEQSPLGPDDFDYRRSSLDEDD
ncbi:MAG TPA: twin-arginine translocase subunit TatC [Nocardioidaceae bacterium]|nr:twin-arginine translocase subunit TatC [Nocardioidaceae bacterium]